MSHKLVSVKLMRLHGSTPKLDTCRLKSNAWKKPRVRDLKEDRNKFKKVRNKIQIGIKKELYLNFVDNFGETAKTIKK